MTKRDNKSMTPLQRVRLEKGLSQTALAEKAVINLRTLQEYEQGRKSLAKASYYTVVSLARALDVYPDSIV